MDIDISIGIGSGNGNGIGVSNDMGISIGMGINMGMCIGIELIMATYMAYYCGQFQNFSSERPGFDSPSIKIKIVIKVKRLSPKSCRPCGQWL